MERRVPLGRSRSANPSRCLGLLVALLVTALANPVQAGAMEPAHVQVAGQEQPTDGNSPGGDSSASAVRVETDLPALVEGHNRIRAEHDLPPLKVDELLSEAAKAHAIDMAAHDYMAHEGKDGSTPGDRVRRQAYPFQKVGENLAQGHPSVDTVLDGWMDSPPHRGNILGAFEEIGVARAFNAEGVPYWSVTFATPWPRLDPSEASRGIVDAINARRRDGGKPALRANRLLSEVAQERAAGNAASGEIRRNSSDAENPLKEVVRRGYRFRALALAEAAGHPTPEDAIRTWAEESEGQLDLLGNFGEVGIGYAAEESGRPYWTLILAQPLSRR